MQKLRLTATFGLAMVIATAAFAQKVTTDHAKDANFGAYKTFMWIKEPKTTNPMAKQRIVDDVNAALTAKGLTLVTSDADIAIAAHAATREEHTLQTFYDGFDGGWRWRGGFGPATATTTINSYEVGTLVVDLFDASTRETVWRGTATKTLSDKPEKNARSLNEAIDKMFRAYPSSRATTH